MIQPTEDPSLLNPSIQNRYLTLIALPTPECTEPSRVVESGQFLEKPSWLWSWLELHLLSNCSLICFCWIRFTMPATPSLLLNPPLGAFKDTPLQSYLNCLALPSPFCSPDKLANIKTPFKDLFQLLLLGMSYPAENPRHSCLEGKGNQPWIFIGRTGTEAEAPILWLPDAKSWLTGKDPDAGKDWRQEEKEATEDEMVGWHHWLHGHELVPRASSRR